MTAWEQRWHPLRQEWVLVAAHRQHRPWSGEQVMPAALALPAHDADCYLCPGNARVSGVRNPSYAGVFVFDNDHPCVALHAPEPAPVLGGELFRAERASGVARVVCYTERHDLTLARLPVPAIVELLRELQAQYRELARLPGVRHVLVFENKGEVVGVSNPHPHCQIYATNFVFRTIEVELEAARRYRAEYGRVLLADVIEGERRDGRRVIFENERALSFVPYFARYAYETYVAPKASHPSLADLSAHELLDLAEALKVTLVRFDNLWQMDFPYVMVLHQAPADAGDHTSFHFHIEFHPPLRQPHLLKYLAGPEIGGGNFLSDTAPEEKAAELRAQPNQHYRERA